MEVEEQVVMSSSKLHDTNNSMKKAGMFFFLLILLEIPMMFFVQAVQMMCPVEYSVLISILMTQGYLVLAAIVYCIITKTHPVKDLQIRKYRVSTFFLSILVLIVASPMASWLNVLSQLFAENTTSNAIYDLTQIVPMWVAILIVGCLPGFVEETLYRGIIYSAFRKRSVLTGILVSALTFGLMHMNFNQMAYAIYLGIIFALLVEATGSLASSMILHMLFNAYNTAYLYILPKLYEFLGQYSSEYANFDMETAMNATPERSMLILMVVVMTPIAIVGLVLTIILLKKIAKINGREFSWTYIKGKTEEVKKTNPWNVGLILGLVVCLAFCVLDLFAS